MANYTQKEIKEEIKRREKESNKLRLLELRKFTDAQLRSMLKESSNE